MPTLRESTTAVVARGEPITDGYCSEPYEAGWAVEAILFSRLLVPPSNPVRGQWWVEISPDGIHWVTESPPQPMPLDSEHVVYYRLSHFGNWIRIRVALESTEPLQLLTTLHLKG